MTQLVGCVLLASCGSVASPEARTPRSADHDTAFAATWTWEAFDAGEPPSYWLPVARERIVDLRNGLGWLSLDGRVVWINLRKRDRAGEFRPPVSIAVTPDELCDPQVQGMLRGWEEEPWALEIVHPATDGQLRCLRGLSFTHLAALRGGQGSYCDLLIEENLLPDRLQGLAVDDCSVPSLRALARYRDLTHLRVGSVESDGIASIATLARLEWLAVLVAASTEIGPLTELRSLKTLRLDGAPADLAVIGRFPHLVELYIHPRPGDDVAEPWVGPPSLRVIDLGFPVEAERLRQLLEHSALREIRLNPVDDAAIAGLRGATSLEVLVLRGRDVGDRALDTIAELDNLRTLDLQGTSITSLAPLHGLSQLRELDLTHTQIDDADLAELRALFELRVLHLRGTPISALQPLLPLTRLNRLSAGRGTGDESLAVLREMRSLTEVDLSDTQVSEQGIASLVAARPELLVSGRRTHLPAPRSSVPSSP